MYRRWMPPAPDCTSCFDNCPAWQPRSSATGNVRLMSPSLTALGGPRGGSVRGASAVARAPAAHWPARGGRTDPRAVTPLRRASSRTRGCRRATRRCRAAYASWLRGISACVGQGTGMVVTKAEHLADCGLGRPAHPTHRDRTRRRFRRRRARRGSALQRVAAVVWRHGTASGRSTAFACGRVVRKWVFGTAGRSWTDARRLTAKA